MGKSRKEEKKKFLKQDRKGNYDIDGVSFDGNNLVVGSGKINSSPRDKENIEKEMNEKPTKLDRKKNLDSEEGTTND